MGENPAGIADVTGSEAVGSLCLKVQRAIYIKRGYICYKWYQWIELDQATRRENSAQNEGRAKTKTYLKMPGKC